MKIKREVNGVTMTFELTDNELYDAYREKEFMFDSMDIEDVICGWEEEDIEDAYGVSKQVFETLIPQMAYEKRRNQDKYDMSWDYARDEAVKTVIANYKSSKLA